MTLYLYEYFTSDGMPCKFKTLEQAKKKLIGYKIIKNYSVTDNYNTAKKYNIIKQVKSRG